MYLSVSGTTVAQPRVSLNHWSLDFSTDKVEVTSFEDANKTYVQGLPDVSMAFEGFFDDADTSNIVAAAKSANGILAYAYPSINANSKYAYGPAWLDFSIDASVSDAVKISGTISANGSWGVNL